MSLNNLQVTSHVARDLLQSAQLFQHEQTVVWEYVSNGLQYIDPMVQPTVKVMVEAKEKKITVLDNGRGMTEEDLKVYFQMHGENIDRKRGKTGRGMFGTGKSAAFGIADTLRLTTTRNGLRCKVQLERKDIDAVKDGDPIPVHVIERNIPTEEANGTFVEVEGIHLKKMDVRSIIHHIERHIAHWPNANVWVNREECKVNEPSYGSERRFSTKDTPFAATLGTVELVVKIAKAPLDKEWQGIAILSKGNWQTTTLAGCDDKPFANYIFGELDVPTIAEDKSPIPPFDMSRSMRLNPRNEIVAQMLAFVGSHVEVVRRELEQADRDRKRDRDAKRLQEEANAIARIINQDFDEWRNKVQKTIATVPGGADKLKKSSSGKEEGEVLIAGPDVPAIIVGEQGSPGVPETPDPEPNPPGPSDPPDIGPKLERTDEPGTTTATPRPKSRSGSAGGFAVEFLRMGQEDSRAKYEREKRTIYINLDHPQIAAASTIGGIEDVAFKRLSYEVAFSEYAIALASELAGSDWYHDITDPIVDIRSTLNRISRAAAGLYSKT